MTASTRGRPARGRGATLNPEGRFETRASDAFDDGWSEPDAAPRQVSTVVVTQEARSIIARNDSPDVPFDQSINPYQGCEHGWVYSLQWIETIRRLAAAGVPTGVLVAPGIPFLNDHELEAVLAAARQAGATSATFIVLRLPHEMRTLFSAWLDEHQPLKRERVLGAILDLRGGRDNDPRFGSRMTGSDPIADLIARCFGLACRRLGFDKNRCEALERLECWPVFLFGVPARGLVASALLVRTRHRCRRRDPCRLGQRPGAGGAACAILDLAPAF